MPITSQRAKFDVMRTRSAATFNGTFLAVGTPLTDSPYQIIFQNNTSVTVQISIDGVNAGLELLTNQSIVLDMNTNRTNNRAFTFPIGTQFYVSGAAGAGNFNISMTLGA